MAAARRRRLSGCIASLTLALLVLLPVAASPSTAAPADPDTPRLAITSITPVADGDGSATVRGTFTNTGTEAITDTRISLVPGGTGSRRSDIAAWADGDDPVTGTAFDTETLDEVPAGGSAPFVLEVSADDLLPQVPVGAAPVSIQDGTGAVHTFIGVNRRKEYVPMGLVWGIPLLLPADTRLFGSDADRATAWRDAVGEDSRLARLTAEAPAKDEAWILDPSLLDVPEGGTDSSLSSAEITARSTRAQALRDTLVGDRTLVLPEADADVAAGTGSREARRLVAGRVARGTRIAESLGARSDVLWPADGLATHDRASALDALRPGGGTTLLVPDSSLARGSFTPTGGTRTTAGDPLVVRDGPLSELVGGLESVDDVLLARQQLVAETASVLGERPGTDRTLVVVPGRDDTPDPEAWERLRAATGDIPWLTGGDLAGVLDDAEQSPSVADARSAAQIREATAGDPVPRNPLTRARAQLLLRDLRSLETFASVRSDGPVWSREVRPSIVQLTSTRWRYDARGRAALQHWVGEKVTLDERDVVVSTGDVNFFADTGRLQISIVNRTDAELTNLVVRLVPGNPSLRIDEDPEPLTIGPDGRQTVTVPASALAAGQVPVHVTVSTPGGHEISAPATLHVKVRPTGASIYWIVGGAAVLLLGAGTWRSLRGGRRAASAPDTTPQES